MNDTATQAKLDGYLEWFIDKLLGYVPNILGALVVLIIGMIVIKIFRRILTGIMTKRADHDPTVLKFLLDVLTWVLRIFLFVMVIQQLGVESTTFAAAIAAAGLAIGLSLQGSLSNFAGGLLIIMFKPFRIGDYIEAQGQAGTVNSIQIFSTRLITPNNQVIYLPNGTLSNNTIKNFSQEPLRRAEIILGVGYDSDLKTVRDVIMKTVTSDNRVLNTPVPNFEVRQLADSAINVAAMFWTERGDYASVVSDFYQNIKTAFEANSIEIPFPQRDLNMKYPGALPEQK